MRPFWMYYGGKWRLAPRYPKPGDTIIEPFAGAAGYSVRHNAEHVFLYDVSPVIVGVWRWLIAAAPAEVLALPDVRAGSTVDDYGLCPEARWFVGFWMNKGVASPRRSPSSWLRRGIRPRSNWGPEVRARIASQLKHIRHWRVEQRDWLDVPDHAGTWFIDPPYQGPKGGHYPHGSDAVDYNVLSHFCHTRRGTVIACEMAGAEWLPFRPLVNAKTTRGHGREVMWCSEVPEPLPFTRPSGH